MDIMPPRATARQDDPTRLGGAHTATTCGVRKFLTAADVVLAAECPELEIVHVNEAPGVLESSAYLLEFDSVHGRWHSDQVEVKDDAMVIDGKTVTYSMHTKVRAVQGRGVQPCSQSPIIQPLYTPRKALVLPLGSHPVSGAADRDLQRY